MTERAFCFWFFTEIVISHSELLLLVPVSQCPLQSLNCWAEHFIPPNGPVTTKKTGKFLQTFRGIQNEQFIKASIVTHGTKLLSQNFEVPGVFPEERLYIMKNKWSFNGHWLHQTFSRMLFLSSQNSFSVCLSFKGAIKINMETAFCVLVLTPLTMLMLSFLPPPFQHMLFFFHLPYVDSMWLRL